MRKVRVTIDGQIHEVEVDLHRREGVELPVVVDGESLRVVVPNLDDPDQMDWLLVGDRSYEIDVDRNLRWLKSYHGMHHIEIQDLEAAVARPASGDGRVKAPIPGKVTRVLVNQGDPVEVGQPIIVLEAMKMENEIRAPRAGSVSALHIQAGQDVQLHMVLAEIT